MGLPLNSFSLDVGTDNAKKLLIQAYKDLDTKGEVSGNPIGSFTVMFNPTSYTRKFELEYTLEKPRGSTGVPEVYRGTKPQELAFSFIVDGTGVSGQTVSGNYDGQELSLAKGEKVNVDDAIKLFTNVATGYIGEKHRPPFLSIVWGSLKIICIAKSVEVSYDLFDAEGQALRATINLAVSTTSTLEAYKAKEDNQSPDLTHVREVVEGQTLPLLTRNIYEDDAYYLEVARINDLNHFRKLKAGTKLFFPPLSK